jgi:hypothetical protein
MTDHKKINDDRDLLSAENLLQVDYRDYCLGVQRDTLTDEQTAILEGVDHFSRANNICHQVIVEAADRIKLLGPEERGEGVVWCEDAGVQAWLDELWVKAAIEDLQGEVTYNTYRDGNTALQVSVNPYSQMVEFRQRLWWNGAEGVFVWHGDNLSEAYAVDEWTESYREGQGSEARTRQRRTVYYEDRIEQYSSIAGGGISWEPFNGGPGSPPVISWLKGDGTPLHIPIIHFANAGRMNTSYVKYGISNLSGGVLNKQDSLNDADADLLIAMRLSAFPQTWVSGYTPSKDAAGNLQAFAASVGPGNIWSDQNEAFKVGTIPPGDISQLLNGKMEILRDVSRMTRTPLHAITGGDWPSGAALDKAELPAVNQAKRMAAKLSPAWNTVFHRATEQANHFLKAGLNEDAMIQVRFASFENRDPAYVLSLERQKFELERDKKNPGLMDQGKVAA